MNGNERTALFIRDTNWNQLPGKVKNRSLMCLLDNLGVTLAGTLAPISKIAAGYAVSNWGGSESTILLHKCSSSAPGAAFTNACAGNALDLDDDAIYTRGHPGAQLFTAALATHRLATVYRLFQDGGKINVYFFTGSTKISAFQP